MTAKSVLPCGAIPATRLEELLRRFGLQLRWVADGEPIPGSYWQPPEAGIVGRRVYARRDTPVHSLLHETCHTICVDAGRRNGLDTEAGGDDAEENAVCYLQIVLADFIEGFGRRRALLDMDRWGYSFRLGSAARWFHEDAEDARTWLLDQGLIDDASRPTWRLRF